MPIYQSDSFQELIFLLDFDEMQNANGTTNGNGHDREYFISPSRGQRDFLQVIEDVIEFVIEDQASKYAVVVGTDSGETITPNGHARLAASLAESRRGAMTKRAGLADFVSVVTVHRIGKHGRYFWKKISDIKTFDRHDRMLKEAYYSLDLAQRVVAQLRDKLSDQLYDFEIHLDIGNNGPTKNMIQEIVGMITGNGFVARIKPDSYAANKVADRYV